MSETFLAINVTVIQLSLNVLLVMDCVTARCGSQVQPTKMTLLANESSVAQRSEHPI